MVEKAFECVLVCFGCHNKYCRLGGLSNTINFSTVLEAGKSNIKVLSGLISSEGFPLCFFCLHMAYLVCVLTDREMSDVSS